MGGHNYRIYSSYSDDCDNSATFTLQSWKLILSSICKIFFLIETELCNQRRTWLGGKNARSWLECWSPPTLLPHPLSFCPSVCDQYSEDSMGTYRFLLIFIKWAYSYHCCLKSWIISSAPRQSFLGSCADRCCQLLCRTRTLSDPTAEGCHILPACSCLLEVHSWLVEWLLLVKMEGFPSFVLQMLFALVS